MTARLSLAFLLARPRARFGLCAALLAWALQAAPALAEPAPARTGLQSPEQRSTRYSAYALPNGTWSLDIGALGVNSNELFGRLGVGRGFKHGFQVDLNLLHWSVGLFGIGARWSFLETRHLALSANVGLNYGHGAWVWILGDLAEEVLSDADLLAFPVGMTASAPLLSWLQLDAEVQYQHAELFGELGEAQDSFYAEAQVGARQLFVRPTVRVFAADATAIEVSSRLPLYTRLPYARDVTLTAGDLESTSSSASYHDVDFAESWDIEVGVRSRLRTWCYATVRLHYGRVSEKIYDAALYPSFVLEFRL